MTDVREDDLAARRVIPGDCHIPPEVLLPAVEPVEDDRPVRDRVAEAWGVEPD